MNRTFSIAIAAAALLTTACAGDEQPQTAGTANGFAAPTKSGTLAKGREVVFNDDMIAGLVSETSQLLFSAGIAPGELLDDDEPPPQPTSSVSARATQTASANNFLLISFSS